MALDIHSPMDLVYECFAKLGLRYICVLRDGLYAGMVSYASGIKSPTKHPQLHRKVFVRYVRELEEEENA